VLKQFLTANKICQTKSFSLFVIVISVSPLSTYKIMKTDPLCPYAVFFRNLGGFKVNRLDVWPRHPFSSVVIDSAHLYPQVDVPQFVDVRSVH
jgi:hypothetical protein